MPSTPAVVYNKAIKYDGLLFRRNPKTTTPFRNVLEGRRGSCRSLMLYSQVKFASMRRFLALPVSVLLLATGFEKP